MAIFSMMTNYSENVLGIFYRRKNSEGEWSGGAMYYLRDGLGAKKGCKTIGSVLAVLFSVFCFLASFGIGNMTQVNSIAGNMKSAFGIPAWMTGLVVMFVAGLVIVGGLKRIAAVTEKIVPFMVILYMVGSIVILITNITMVPAVFVSIFKSAFGLKAVGGGIVGYGLKQAVVMGMKRGIFSNEAGLGSSVMVHSNSNVKEPVRQGMWGIFEVFADTIIVCTLTAFTVLSSGLVDLETGETLTEYGGTVMGDNLAWDIADTLNGLMALPNLIGVLVLSPIVAKITKNYVDRKIKGRDIEPMLSNFPEIQAEHTAAVKKGAE